jgi:dihydroorotate dehydrogenase electron transfer subunit
LNRLFKACITENVEVVNNYHLITLSPLEKIQKPEPGNFFMLSIDDRFDPLLKRPFSVHRWLDGNFQLLYRVVGKGTTLLSNKKPGDLLDIIGPLGNAFPLKKSQKNTLMVAGGLGIAPIFALAEKLIPAPPSSVRTRKSEGRKINRPLFFYGARTREELLCINALKSLGIDPIISTDDGSAGYKGNIITVLKRHLSRQGSRIRDHVLFSCGPEPMLKSLSRLVEKYNLKGFIALEQNMACGLGTCLGCTVNTTGGYKRVCKEGPVFPVKDIVWE